jgi:hypothetical protein
MYFRNFDKMTKILRIFREYQEFLLVSEVYFRRASRVSEIFKNFWGSSYFMNFKSFSRILEYQNFLQWVIYGKVTVPKGMQK